MATTSQEKVLKALLAQGAKQLQTYFDSIPKEWGVESQIESRYTGPTHQQNTVEGDNWCYWSVPQDQGKKSFLSVLMLVDPTNTFFMTYLGTKQLKREMVPTQGAKRALKGVLERLLLSHVKPRVNEAEKAFKIKEQKTTPEPRAFSTEQVTRFLKGMSTRTGGRHRDVDFYDERHPYWDVEPLNRQRLDHYGNDGDGWDDEGWAEDYADPLAKEVQEKLESEFGKGTFSVDIGEKGHIEVNLTPAGMKTFGKTARKIQRVAIESEPLDFVANRPKGWCAIKSGGDVASLTQALNDWVLRGVPSPQEVSKVKGATKGFSFHWSNAQGKWHVITVPSFPWGIDGAEFILFVGRNARSPLGKAWSLTEMRYVAKNLRNHPGYAFSVRASINRVALSFLQRGN